MKRALLLSTILAALLAVPASATIKIRESETLDLLQETKKVDCEAHKRFFVASAPRKEAYRLTVAIGKPIWAGYGHDYDIFFGDQRVVALVSAPGDTFYTSDVDLPGTPPGTVQVGGVKFSPKGKRISVGAFGLSTLDLSAGVVVSGAAKCASPRLR